MKHFILFAFLLAAFTTQANIFSTYQQHIATDRVLVKFNDKLSPAAKQDIIKASGLVTASAHINASLTVCLVSNYQAAQQYFAAREEVTFVSFFITDGKHHAGVQDGFFVKLKDKNFEPQLRTMVKDLGIAEVKADKYIANLYLLHVAGKTENTISVCEAFAKQNWCEYAAPDYLVNPLVTSNDPLYTRQWPIANSGTTIQGSGTVDADMDVDTAWTITTGSSTIKVSIVDSGVDTLHADLADNMLPGHDAINDSTDGYPTPTYDEDGHGTCCAGIVAAVKDNGIGVAGVAPSCKIIPVRSFHYVMLGTQVLPYSSAAAFADAIGWSWSVAEADILSNSWGLPPALISFLPGGMAPVDDAIQTAYTNGRNGKGCAMFFSSGNEGDSIGPIWPGRLDNVIAVNATSMCDERKMIGDCSGEQWGGDYGPGLDFSAPGVRVPTTDMRGNNGFVNGDYYFTFNGTSAACPNAAAVGALVLSMRSELTADGVRAVIAQTCDKVGGYAYDSTMEHGTWTRELGYGRVNAFRAVQYANIYSSVKDVANELNWKVFPNPAKDVLTILSSEPQGTVAIYNLAGQVVLQSAVNGNTTVLDVSSITGGMYVVQLRNTHGTAVSKVTLVR